MEQETHKPDVLRLAVTAAGGTEKVAKRMQVGKNAVQRRVEERYWPSHELRPLLRMGGDIIPLDTLLTYIEDSNPVGKTRG